MSNSWQFYTDTANAWQSMLGDLAHAEKIIDFEQFVFMTDDVGQQFIEVLKSKARKGLRVRLLVDYVGSFGFVNSHFATELIESGAELQYYNPIKPWRLHNFSSWFWRNHRKLLIVDNKVAHIGGVGVDVSMRWWRDTQVRVEGEVVNEARFVFDRMWQNILEGKFRRFKMTRFGYKDLRFWTNSPHFRERYVYRELIRSIRKAKSYVYLTTPYFIPSKRLFFNLIRTAKRGVDVRIIVPLKSDHYLVDMASNSYYTLAIKSGIRIYNFKNRVLHAKTAVIDDNWATVGSTNLDNLSFVFNYEANLVGTDINFVNDLKEHFINDILESDEVRLETWSRRSVFQKVIEILTWPFHGIM